MPLLSEATSVQQLLDDSLLSSSIANAESMSELIIERLGSVGCKTALRLVERAIGTAVRLSDVKNDSEDTQLAALGFILDDLADEVLAGAINR